MITDINTVIEAAEIRAAQWRSIANGLEPQDVVDELYESAAMGREEAASIAEEQEAACRLARNALPSSGTSGAAMDVLANNAMCLWEAMLQMRRNCKEREDIDRVDRYYDWLADGEGAFSARDGCWQLSGAAETAWDAITEGGDPPPGFDAFDWDFIPCWLAELAHFCIEKKIGVTKVDKRIARSIARTVVSAAQ